MRKLSTKDRIQSALSYLQDTRRFILDERTKIIRVHGTTETSIDKQIGSELCYLYRGIEELESILAGQDKYSQDGS